MIIYYKFIAAEIKDKGAKENADKHIDENFSSDEFILTCYKKYCQYIGHDILPVEISRLGKPHFISSPICFNLSHSGNLVAVAFSENEVGLDIENYSRAIDGRLAKYLSVKSIDDWTKLEACAKFDGTGIKGVRSVNLNNYRVRNIKFFPDYSLAVCGDDEVRFVEIKE